MPDPAELTPSQRSALAIFYILSGCPFTTAEIARRIGLPRASTYRLLCRLSLVFGLYQDDKRHWRLLDECIESESPGAGRG